MKAVIDRLSADTYGESLKAIIGCQVIFLNDLEKSPFNDGYVSGFYDEGRGDFNHCSSFTCVCIDSEGYPL